MDPKDNERLINESDEAETSHGNLDLDIEAGPEPIANQTQLSLEQISNANQLKLTLEEKLPTAGNITFPTDPNLYKYGQKYLQIITNVGSGASGHVCIYKHKEANKLLAIKTIKRFTFDQLKKDEKEFNQKVNEINVLKTLADEQFPHIIDFYGFDYNLDNAEIYICMEPMDISLKGLYLRIHMHDRFPEELFGFIAVAIVKGLDFCQKRHIIHRDLKPDNVLLDKNGNIKIADFGASRILDESLASTYIGTIAYWPPERFNFDSNIYSPL